MTDRIRATLRAIAARAHLEPAPAPPTQVHISVTDRCNFACRHCAIHRKRTRDLPTADWLAFIDAVGDWLGGGGINFAGGEPLLRRDLEQLISRAVARGFATTFNTNGWDMGPERAASIVASGVSIVYVSLDGATAATVDWTRGRPGAFDRAHAAIDALQAAGCPQIIVAAILHGRNAAEIPALLEFVRARGLQLVIQPLYQTFDEPHDPCWYQRSELWPQDLATTEAALDLLADTRRAWGPVCNATAQIEGIRRYFRDPGTHNGLACRAGHTDLAVDPQGNLRLCFMLDPIGHVGPHPELAWVGPRALHRRWQVSRCGRPCNLLNCNFEGIGGQ